LVVLKNLTVPVAMMRVSLRIRFDWRAHPGWMVAVSLVSLSGLQELGAALRAIQARAKRDVVDT
jgi:hypothetical protein